MDSFCGWFLDCLGSEKKSTKLLIFNLVIIKGFGTFCICMFYCGGHKLGFLGNIIICLIKCINEIASFNLHIL